MLGKQVKEILESNSIISLSLGDMKGFTLFIILFLGLAIYFFKVNPFVSLICLLILLGGLYGSGKIG